MLRLRRARTVEQFREWGSLYQFLDKLFPVTVLLILIGGLSMAVISWGWTHPWIDVSLGLLVLMGALGPTIQGRRLNALYAEAAAAPAGPAGATLLRRIEDPVVWASVLAMAGTMLGVVALMIFKPDYWVSALAIIVVAAILGLGVGLALGRPRPASVERPQPQEQTIL